MPPQKATPQIDSPFFLLTGQTSSDTKGFCKPTLLIMSAPSFSGVWTRNGALWLYCAQPMWRRDFCRTSSLRPQSTCPLRGRLTPGGLFNFLPNVRYWPIANILVTTHTSAFGCKADIMFCTANVR